MATAKKHQMTREERKVIFASSLGTVFEWYDFYLYGTLATVIGKQFFSGSSPNAQFIFSLLAFAAGFAVRPFGAVIFGRLGDLAGRKFTFLITIVLMGGSTVLIGFLPTYSMVGIFAPIMLIALRLLQGLALGGEYGGAATYVGEHAPKGRRGEYTAWIQITATMGLFMALLVILACRLWLRDDSLDAAHMDQEFDSWGWRIPFILSAVLLAVSVWIRTSLNESPVFLKMQKEGKGSKSPLKDSFTKWPNLRLVILALFGLTMGQAVIWYGGQFYALLFLTQTVRVDPVTANLMVAFALLLATPFFIFFGWLSDRIGRKWIILTGCLIAAIIYFPTFKAITHYANPALEQAIASNPVVLKANSNNCSTQFDPTGTVKFTTSCDTATAFLAKRGVPYTKLHEEAAGLTSVVMIGGKEIPGFDKTDPNAKELEAKFNADMNAALTEAKYPATANPAEINYGMVMLLLWILVLLVTMVYGPIAALLIEMFPTRIRYTSMSLPYHIGNGWFGGFLPFIVFSIVVATGDVYQGLWYPVIVALITVVIGALFIREGKEE